MASTIPVEPVSNGSSSPSTGEDDKRITMEKLKEHTTRDSMWLLLHDKVYDVTRFLDEHPGGDEVMMEESGRDATEAFEDVGHSDEARQMMPKMLIGEFKGETTTKTKKAPVTRSASSTKSSGGFPVWVIIPAVLAGYLAWRVFYA